MTLEMRTAAQHVGGCHSGVGMVSGQSRCSSRAAEMVSSTYLPEASFFPGKVLLKMSQKSGKASPAAGVIRIWLPGARVGCWT